MTDTRTHAREEKKLSVVPKGHWRNKWRVHVAAFDKDTLQRLGPGEHIMSRRYPSRELAEQYATLPRPNPNYPFEYLGPVFFPEKSDP